MLRLLAKVWFSLHDLCRRVDVDRVRCVINEGEKKVRVCLCVCMCVCVCVCVFDFIEQVQCISKLCLCLRTAAIPLFLTEGKKNMMGVYGIDLII